MNISAITYSNYQNGFTYNPTQKVSAQDSDTSEENNSSLQPIVNTDIKQPVTESTSPDTKNNEESNPQSSNDSQAQSTNTTKSEQVFTEAELRLIDELKQIDTEIRRHEMAHVAAGGRYITSGANFSYKKGPDGANYAVAGEVGIDSSPIPGDPQGTIKKMRQIKSAALAPAQPSSQDLKVAAQATSTTSKALSELMIMQAKEQAKTNEKTAFGNLKNATDSYEKVNQLPDGDTSTFQIAV
jgi:hypothetical protein